MTFELYRQIFKKNTQISNIMKLRLVRAQLFRTERHDEANSLNVVTSRCDTQLYKRKESAVCHNSLRIIS